MTPIVDAANADEERYTKLHCKARCSVERCIGVLKGRFRCLMRARVLHYEPHRAAQIVKACAVLHNMCLSVRRRDTHLVATTAHPPQPHAHVFGVTPLFPLAVVG